MAGVPVYGERKVSARTLPSVAVRSPADSATAAAPARQLQEIGGAAMRTAGAFGDMMAEQSARLNVARTDEANNKLKELEMRLTFDPKEGYSQRRGIAMLEGSGGKSPVDEYAERYAAGVSEISATLGNDAQKAVFAHESASSATAFREGLLRHRAAESDRYQLSVRKATIDTRTREIALNYGDPAKTREAALSIRESAYQAAMAGGLSSAEADGAALEAESKGHAQALKSALQNGDTGYAAAYLKANSGRMVPDDILQINGALQKDVEAKQGFALADKAINAAMPALRPSESDRAFNIAVNTESGGRQFDKDGNPLRSSKGAIGIAQVMPGTGPEAAELAGLKWDEVRYRNDPAYNRAIGKAYFVEQLRTFGSVAQAYAAYNAGPTATAEALAYAEEDTKAAAKEGRAPRNWLSFLPKETRDYVVKNNRAFLSGGGKPKQPSLADIQDGIRADATVLGTSPEAVKMALDEAKRRYDAHQEARKQEGDGVKAEAFSQIAANGGDFTALTPDIRAALPPEDMGAAMDFAKKIAAGTPPETDWATFYALKSEPALLAKTNLFAFRDKLSDSEFKQLTQQQATMREKGEDGLVHVRTTKEIINQYIKEAGLNPDPKPGDKEGAAQVGKIWGYFENRLKELQSQTGKKPTYDEMSKEAARMFVTTVKTPGFWGDKDTPLYEADFSKVPIPEDIKPVLIEAFRSKGVYDAITSQMLVDGYAEMVRGGQ